MNSKRKVLYVTAKGGIHDYRFLKKLAADYEVLLLHYAADGLIDEIKNIKDLRIISKTPFKKSFPLLSEYWHFKRTVREFNPDIIHTGYVWQVGILASYMNFHPHLSMVWGSDVLIEPAKRSFIKRIVSKVMKQADHIQCDADFVKSTIIKDYSVAPEKITVFPWGIDLDVFSKVEKTESRQLLNLEEDKFIVIFNRHLEPIYDPLGTLEGFRRFAEDKKDVLLLMLSDGSLKDEAMVFISSSGLEDKIRVIGSKPNEQMPFYLNAADVYISASLSDGTSLSLLEAMACGLGMVLSDLPAIREWAGESNSLLVPRKNPDAIADALNKYYEKRKLVIDHGNKNMEIASQRADWNKNYNKLKEIYTSLFKA